jgi:two-component system alkaline phosphatase synthesis response regulator PhoP
MKKILLAEDEENLASIISLNLDIEGFKVTHTDNGLKALEIAKNENFHLVILDVMLPEMDGIQICKEIRKFNSEVPILFLTAKGTSQDRVEGLKSGADDYLVKPFELEEFILRVHNLSKRYTPDSEIKTYTFRNFEINFSSHEIKGINGLRAQLSKREIQLLKILIEKKGQVVSRDELMERLWSHEDNPSARTIDNYILNFRKLFEKNSREPRHFHSIRGVGYKFNE